MKAAIEFLTKRGLLVDNEGNIISGLPEHPFEAIELSDSLENATANDDEEYCYTIIEDKIVKIDI